VPRLDEGEASLMEGPYYADQIFRAATVFVRVRTRTFGPYPTRRMSDTAGARSMSGSHRLHYVVVNSRVGK
jgi:hypothetical protein